MCYPCIAPLHPRNGAAPQAPTEDEAAVSAGGLTWVFYVLFRHDSSDSSGFEKWFPYYSSGLIGWGWKQPLEAIHGEKIEELRQSHNSNKERRGPTRTNWRGRSCRIGRRPYCVYMYCLDMFRMVSKMVSILLIWSHPAGVGNSP